MGFDMIYI